MKELILNAFKNLRYTFLRSLLTLLGVVVGVAVGVAVINIGHSTEKSILGQFENLGAYVVKVNFFTKQPVDTEKLLFIQKKLKNNINIIDVAVSVDTNSSLFFDGESKEVTVHAITDNFFDISGIKLTTGRTISNLDGDRAFGLLSENFRQGLGDNNHLNLSELGKEILLNKNFFTLIGFVEEVSNQHLSLTDLNQALFVSFAGLKMLGLNPINNTFTLLREKNVKFEDFAIELNEIFTNLSIDNISISNHEEIISNVREQGKTANVAFLLISFISIIGGSIGIMNIMLISVTERHKEIGLRLAVGAKPVDIKLQFLTEAMVLCFVGGFVGILLGTVIAYCFVLYFGTSFFLSFWSILIGFLSITLIGLFSGYYPASAASKLTPVETLYKS